MSWNKAYPLAVPWARTSSWYDQDWREMATWCNQAFGPGEWEYFNSEFRFKDQKQVNWFNMRWQE